MTLARENELKGFLRKKIYLLSAHNQLTDSTRATLRDLIDFICLNVSKQISISIF